jgi:hypothetical protein
MKHLKLFENYLSKISSVLKNLPSNEDFLYFLINTKSYKPKITRHSLIDGYCNDVTVFIKWLFPDSEMLMSDNHSFIKYNNFYYDAYNYNGVKNYNELHFFKTNPVTQIRPFKDTLHRIELLNKFFDNSDRLEILNEEMNTKLWYHGTDADFSQFREPDDTTKPTSKLGIWFTDDKEYTEYFGNKVITAKLTYNNPYIISLKKWNDIRDTHAKDAIYFHNLREKIIKAGYDAFYVKGEDDSFAGMKVSTPDVIAVFFKTQIEII